MPPGSEKNVLKLDRNWADMYAPGLKKMLEKYRNWTRTLPGFGKKN